MKLSVGRLVLGAIALATVLAIVSGCGTTTETTTQTATVTETETTAAQNPAAQTSQQPAVPAKPWWRLGMQSRGFQSPTANIHCTLAESGELIVCQTLNNRQSVELGTILPADDYVRWTVYSGPPLAYGRTWHSPNFYCWSAIDGVICRSLYSKHGFMINRSGRWTETFRYVPNLATDYGGSGAYAYGGTYSGSGGSGYTVICADGWVSQSGGIQGACSSHGGYG